MGAMKPRDTARTYPQALLRIPYLPEGFTYCSD